MKVFLGGTCNDSQMEKTTNPSIKDWLFWSVGWLNDTARKNELRERQNTDYCSYVLTPLMSEYIQ